MNPMNMVIEGKSMNARAMLAVCMQSVSRPKLAMDICDEMLIREIFSHILCLVDHRSAYSIRVILFVKDISVDC